MATGSAASARLGYDIQMNSVASHSQILDLVARHKLPAMYALSSFVVSGGLMSYGPSLSDHFRRAASYVDKIIRGAKPADLPVEQPAKFELVVNPKTANALQLALQRSILLRADRVIE